MTTLGNPVNSQMDIDDGDIMPVNIAAFDRNRLVVCDALKSEQDDSRPASRLGKSQPTISKALYRLR